MSKKTLTKVQLVNAIYTKSGYNRVESKDLVESILGLVRQAIKKDQAMLLSGFGKFEAYAKNARLGRNPQTNERMPLPPRTVVVFRLSRKFRAALNSEG